DRAPAPDDAPAARARPGILGVGWIAFLALVVSQLAQVPVLIVLLGPHPTHPATRDAIARTITPGMFMAAQTPGMLPVGFRLWRIARRDPDGARLRLGLLPPRTSIWLYPAAAFADTCCILAGICLAGSLENLGWLPPIDQNRQGLMDAFRTTGV